jgi:trans-aconitate methyltransferase
VTDGTSWMRPGSEQDAALDARDLRSDVAHSARVYDYLLGGKDNFEADRAAAAEIVKHVPSSPMAARANRQFMVRMTRYLVSELGIRQFLDIGTGLPTSPNLHEAAQQIAPECRVLYVDNDPIVLAHARALLTSTPQGKTAYLEADVRDTDAVLGSRELRETLDLERPVALTLLAILHMFTDDDEAHALMRRLLEPLAPGSVLALSVVPDVEGSSPAADAVAATRSQGIPMKLRTKAETERFFDGLDLIGPGVTRVNQWYPDQPADTAHPHHMYAGVAIKR